MNMLVNIGRRNYLNRAEEKIHGNKMIYKSVFDNRTNVNEINFCKLFVMDKKYNS